MQKHFKPLFVRSKQILDFSLYRKFFKRLLDLVLSLFTLVVLSPVMLFIALAIRLEDGGPSLFRQKRVGRNGELFHFLKFRSMPVNTGDIPSNKALEIRITRIGRIIRRTNLDELPQLFNILRGDMSIVGPRPAIQSQSELCELRKASGASACTPGLTGLAQVNSYDNMPEQEKAGWDSQYAHNITFFGDIAIIFRTFRYLLSPPPVY